jgi:signal transduction histidine kinase
VEVSAGVRDGEMEIVIADRGPGVPPDALPRLFDKFYRAPNAPAGGAGLGLSLVKGFVEVQGGHVTARLRPGGGIAFALRLPLSGTKPKSPEKPLATATL